MTSKTNKDQSYGKILNSQEVLTAAQSASTDPQVKVLNYTLIPYSDRTLGYIGSYYQLKISIQRSTHDGAPETLTLFVKALPSHCDDSSPEQCLFNKETSFFKLIAREFYEIYHGEKWSPICHFIRNDVIVMEDLKLQGYNLLGFETHDDYEVMKSTLETLARYHACSLLLEDKWSRESESPTTILERYPEICKEYVFDPSSKGHLWVSQGIGTTISVADRLGYDTRKLRDTIDKIYEILKPSKVHRNALCHGDLWLKNRMYAEKNASILLDFQGIRYVPMAVDIVQLFYLGTTSAFRARHERELIEFYHSVLREAVQSSRLTVVPTLDEILLAVDELRLYGPVVACLYVPTTMIDPKIVEDTQESTDESASSVFSDRTRAALLCLEKDATFKSRMNDAIGELVKISESLRESNYL